MGVEQVFGISGKTVVPRLLELALKGISLDLSRHDAEEVYITSAYSLMNESIGEPLVLSSGIELDIKKYRVAILAITLKCLKIETLTNESNNTKIVPMVIEKIIKNKIKYYGGIIL